MEEPYEKIEVGLDSRTDQITIVVGTDQNTVQSVVVLKSEWKQHSKNRLQLWSRTQKRSPSLGQQLASLKDTTRFRSELLRPNSPISLRSIVAEGRGRDSARDDHNTLRRSHRQHQGRSFEPRQTNTTTSQPTPTMTRSRSRSTTTTALSGATRSSLFLGKNTRDSKCNKKTENTTFLDSHGCNNNNNLPALKEGKSYVHENTTNGNESKPRFYRRTFRHNRVDPVLVTQDS
jgi:hypothetical protein